jgi:AraC family transcriptional regulator
MAVDRQPLWDELDASSGSMITSTSGPNLRGLVVKRSVFEPSTDMVAAVPDTHIVTVHNSVAVNFRWREGRRIRKVLVAPGHVLVNPAGYIEERAWDQRTEDVRVGIALDSAYVSSSKIELRPAIGVYDPLLGQLARSLSRTFEAGPANDSLYADALAYALGAHLIEHYSDHQNSRQTRDSLGWRQLEQVYDYIECNLHQPLTVTELATVAGVSPSHFARLFSRQTGQPPHRYVRDRRLDRAERLIVETQVPLAAIAAAVGFSDQSHLNRVLLAKLGLTPGQLRDSMK